jgi:hypothetical protein
LHARFRGNIPLRPQLSKKRRRTSRPATPSSRLPASITAGAEPAEGALLIVERLDGLMREAAHHGVAQPEAVRAVMAWAAGQSFMLGGYPHMRSVMLDTLETVLILELAKKNAA